MILISIKNKVVESPSVMVGVPGKSKGCNTCRRRKIRVSILNFINPAS